MPLTTLSDVDTVYRMAQAEKILKALGNSTMSPGSIAVAAGISSNAVSTVLGILRANGRVERCGPAQWRRKYGKAVRYTAAGRPVPKALAGSQTSVSLSVARCAEQAQAYFWTIASYGESGCQKPATLPNLVSQ
jgi:hypothetical protein